MLSIAKLVPDQAAYYERSVAAGRDDYYSGRGEAPGRWLGSEAGRLGLAGELTKGQLSALLRFEVETVPEALRRSWPAREIRVPSVDRLSGQPVSVAKTLEPVAGFDLVFSTPKSMSVLEQVADETTAEGRYARAAVAEAHQAGLAAALGYLEREACEVRAGAGGAQTLRGGGFVASGFDHRTSRAQDPHRHTHVIVANVARSAEDGKWRALDGRALIERERLAAGYLYQAELRRAMSARGFRWGEVSKGMAELAEVPGAVVREFSTRRREILQHMAARGTEGHDAAQAAALVTRQAKEPARDLAALREAWRARAAEHGMAAQDLLALVRGARERVAVPAQLPEHRALAARLSGPEGLTELSNSFGRPDAVRAVAAAHPQGATAGQVEAFVEAYLAGEQVAALAPGRHTTRDLLACEDTVLAHAARRREAGVGVLRRSLVDAVLAERGGSEGALAPEQAEVVRAATSSGRGLELVQALAGTGKTRTLGALGQVYRRAGYEVVGVAPTGRAARELRSVGVPARTLDSLVALLDRAGGLPTGRPVVVLNDEAGMNGTRLWARLLAHAEAAGAKVIACGDQGQLQSVPAGGAFRALAEREGALTLATVLRQRDPAQRAALCAIREGRPLEFIGWQIESELLVWGSRDEMARQAVAEWATLQADLGWGQVALIARSNDLRDELNLRAGAEARAAGWVSGPELEAVGRSFAAGDRVICRRNDRVIDTDNGDRATVIVADPDAGTIRARADDGRMLVLGPDYLAGGHLEHGYALTGHGAQGGTLEHALVVARGLEHSREWSYTAHSRERSPSRAFLITEPTEPEEDHHKLRASPWREPVADYLAGLARSDAEALAGDQAEARPWAPEWEAPAPARPSVAPDPRFSSPLTRAGERFGPASSLPGTGRAGPVSDSSYHAPILPL